MSTGLARAEATGRPSRPPRSSPALIFRSRAASMAVSRRMAAPVAELDAVEPRSAPGPDRDGPTRSAHAHVTDDRLDEAAGSPRPSSPTHAGRGGALPRRSFADRAGDRRRRGWELRPTWRPWPISPATSSSAEDGVRRRAAGLTSIVRPTGPCWTPDPSGVSISSVRPPLADRVSMRSTRCATALRAAALVDIGRVEEAVPELRLAQTQSGRPVLVQCFRRSRCWWARDRDLRGVPRHRWRGAARGRGCPRSRWDVLAHEGPTRASGRQKHVRGRRAAPGARGGVGSSCRGRSSRPTC